MKKYGITEPKQWKNGSWFSQVIDPDNNQILYETLDFTKNWCLIKCIFYVEYINAESSPITPDISTNSPISGAAE